MEATADSLYSGLLVALVGALGAVLGAAATVALQSRSVVQQDSRHRAQRQRDLLIAMHAEILAGVGASRHQLTPEERAYALANDNPFATPDDNDFVFAGTQGDLSILPEPVIHSVVQYYRRAAQSNAMTRDLRDVQFREQSVEERRKFVALLLGVVGQQRRIGHKALDEIESYGDGLGLDLAAKRIAFEAADAAPAMNASDDGNDRADHDASSNRQEI
ncbi:hypothetical protein NVS89_03345 [Ancylobacter sp. MQZ15Z-1]|uniref:Uncharacterized protein n=1 Tax=Ancylobacter mangrovi TaxID=2972472 RepID=A0A9X2PB39_9HYPH|nr:hypothetical protein [Ancylobacter mangrovi]MCS0494119.1 hypothetical protein [Ancylobacter mangrovi]